MTVVIYFRKQFVSQHIPREGPGHVSLHYRLKDWRSPEVWFWFLRFRPSILSPSTYSKFRNVLNAPTYLRIAKRIRFLLTYLLSGHFRGQSQDT